MLAESQIKTFVAIRTPFLTVDITGAIPSLLMIPKRTNETLNVMDVGGTVIIEEEGALCRPNQKDALMLTVCQTLCRTPMSL